MKISTLIEISRPKFWGYLGGTFLVGYTIGIQDLTEFYTLTFFYLLFFFLLPANFFLYGINDLFDQDTDQYNSKKGQQEHRLQKTESTKLVLFLLLSLLLALPAFLLLPSLIARIFFILFIFLAAFYSAPPLRFKSKPIIDSASNVLYILPGLIGYQLTANQLSWPIMLAISCWAVAMHLFSAIPDIEADKKAQLKTSAIFFGQTPSLLLCSLLWIIFAGITLQISQLYPYSLLTMLYPLIPLIAVFNNKISLSRIYWYFPWLNNLLGFLLFILVVLEKI
jgi:4-hydroxybenzoate polyprenyltransferase